MKYSLHPEALGDLRDAASFYREKAGTSLSQSFLGEFEQSINRLLLHPSLGSPWRGRGRRSIGRNVVNFQYLEATLRSMIPALSNKGTLKELHANQDEVSRKYKRSSLGDLANACLERLYGKSVADEALSDEVLPETTFAFSTRIKVSPKKAAQRKRGLIKLIAERNRLIHQDLLSVDLNSREECEKLSARLDEQYTRIRRYLDYLNSVRIGFREMAAELRRFFESDEFLALLRGDRDDT